jgi:ankyrin repeat protein
MPVSTRSKGKGGKQGAKKTAGNDSVVMISKSKKPKTQREDGFTVAERCTERLARQSKAKRDARDDRKLNPKEQVLRVPLTRDKILQHFNPFKLSDLQTVLSLRQFYGLLPDIDLKECYFEKAWGFQKEEFVLAEWQEMSVEEMKRQVRRAHPWINDQRFYPPWKVDVNTLDTKEDIVRAFWELTYVPAEVYKTAVGGAHVLGLVAAGKVGEDRNVVGRYLRWACGAGLDASLIRGLAGKCGEYDIGDAALLAAMGGHTNVVDLLVSVERSLSGWHSAFLVRYPIGVHCLTHAAAWGQNAMIDHLVGPPNALTSPERYGLDPNAEDTRGWTALRCAAKHGRVRTVQHLVEKHNVDIHAYTRDRTGKTALYWAEVNGRTECASYLRELEYGELVAGESGGAVDGRLLLSAACRGDDAMIDLLVEKYGLDPNAPDRDGWTALHLAAESGRVRTVQHLVEKYDVDIHARLVNGVTALGIAKTPECASFLRELEYAQLVAGEYGGAVDAYLLELAGGRGDDAMIDLLVERYGLDPNAAAEGGWTALHLAAAKGNFRTVRHLVEKYNVDILANSMDGTALDLAELNGRTECASYLRELAESSSDEDSDDDGLGRWYR